MFTPEERDRIRTALLELARIDQRITGGAITGSASVGTEDRWSDIDLAFGVRQGSDFAGTLADFSERMYREHHALHHLDVESGAWTYRVFLLPSALQVDLAFAPEPNFGARAPTFRLAFGAASEVPPACPPPVERLIGWAWLYALHARSSLARRRPWQAEYMISGMRDQVLSLACRRHDFPSQEGRGIDRLPREVKAPLEDGLVRSLDPGELARAFGATTAGLLTEIRSIDLVLAGRLEPILRELVEMPQTASGLEEHR